MGLKINVDVAARPRTFLNAVDLVADAGNRYTGSISRTYIDIAKQWDDAPATATADLTQLMVIDEVSVKKTNALTAADPLPVDIGAFTVIPGGAVTACAEYGSTKFVDKTTAATKLNKAGLTAITKYGHLRVDTDAL